MHHKRKLQPKCHTMMFNREVISRDPFPSPPHPSPPRPPPPHQPSHPPPHHFHVIHLIMQQEFEVELADQVMMKLCRKYIKVTI